MNRRDVLRATTAAIALGPCSLAGAAATGPEVKVRQGRLRGFEEDGVLKFLGVPFAQPPVGALRWAPPQPKRAWAGVRPAKAFGSAAIQMAEAVPSSYRTLTMSEDCLYLNVWTTSQSKTARQPVMVWIHGGGDISGAASEAFTDGSNLAKAGVTVVAANYRLGVFGFLNHPTLGANFGILDQIAALHWVRDNIVAFGGDPSRVLVFGYSAGAVNIRALLQSPLAKGLFSCCAIQSAGGENPAATPFYDFARSRTGTEKLMQALGTSDVDALRAIPAPQLAAAARPLSGTAVAGPRTPFDLVWAPVPDGNIIMEDRFPAWGPDLPVIFSSCRNEARYFLDPARRYTSQDVEAMARKLTGPKADEVLAILQAEGGTPLQQLDHLFTDLVWWETQYASLRRFAREGRRIYSYRFTRLCPGSAKSNRLVFHGSDVYYVFGNMIDREYDDTDRRISRELQQVYVEFARTGVPKLRGATAGRHFRNLKRARPSLETRFCSVLIPRIPFRRSCTPCAANPECEFAECLEVRARKL
ncbi:MAG: para-nitrobenzyl esterase [Bradyrhizobium sp.]|nr:para-nitrobenzyl esterase [Bradyrhizobium sp.]